MHNNTTLRYPFAAISVLNQYLLAMLTVIVQHGYISLHSYDEVKGLLFDGISVQ